MVQLEPNDRAFSSWKF